MIKTVIAALSVPEHCLSFYFVCDGDDQILQNGESNRDLLLSVTNRKALARLLGGGGGGHNPQSPPLHLFKTLITLLPVTFSQHDPQLGVLVVEKG